MSNVVEFPNTVEQWVCGDCDGEEFYLYSNEVVLCVKCGGYNEFKDFDVNSTDT